MKTLGFWLLVACFAFFFIFPLYILFKISFSAPVDIFTLHPPYLIHNFTPDHFLDVFASGTAFFQPLIKSVAVGIFSSLGCLVLGAPAAYAISRMSLRWRSLLVLIIFFTRMFPEVSIALPISIGFIRIGLFDTVAGLTICHIIRNLPVACFILTGVFSGFPRELEKQAFIDGYSRLRTFFKVVLPLTAGGIAVAGIFSFMLSWDEFVFASYLSLTQPTMPVKMYYYVSRGDLFSSAAYAVIITVPVLVMTFALQKYLRPDYLAGAVKG
jgi:trehalose transport system permease protein